MSALPIRCLHRIFYLAKKKITTFETSITTNALDIIFVEINYTDVLPLSPPRRLTAEKLFVRLYSRLLLISHYYRVFMVDTTYFRRSPPPPHQ